MRLGVIALPPSTIRVIQQKADAGDTRATYYRNPVSLLFHNLPGYGFKGTFTIDQPLVLTIRYAHKGYDVQLRQLAKKGNGGAWFITSVTPHAGALPPAPTPIPGSPPTPVPGAAPRVGPVPHTAAAVKTIQSQVTAGSPAYAYYLNPVALVEHNLGQQGFTLPVPIVQPLVITVTFQGKKYDIVLSQPGKQGVTGIWVTRDIRLHR